MKKTNIIITIVILFASTLLHAQSHNEEVTVEGSFTPHIKKSERIIMNPELPKHEFDIPDYQVNTKDFFYSYILDLEPISPVLYNNINTYDITKNFVKAGIGTQLSPDFLFRHYSNLSKNMSLGIGVAHNSTWLQMKDHEPNTNYMNNDFNVSMNNRFSRFQLHSYIDYDYDMYHLNNGDDNDSRRDIHSLNVKLSANNNQTSYKSVYNEFLLDYTYTGIASGIQENLAKFKAHVEHSNSWFRNNDGIQTLAIDINADIDNINQTLFVIAANPYLSFDGEYYKLHLGFRVDAKTNSTSLGGIYPDLKGSLYLFSRNVEFYAGLGGKTKINTLKEILEENPFIVSDMTNIGEFDYEKTKFDFKGGLRLKIMNRVSGHIGVRYRDIDNHLFYISSMNETGTFDVILYDCNIFNFIADLQFKLQDNFKLEAHLSWNKYDIISNKDRYIPAWHKPGLEVSFRGIYKINENWDVNMATYIESDRYALTPECNIEKMKPICDIQLGCDYKIQDNLSLYAEIKNLIHNKYQMYYGYPSYGFQAFLGFKYRFL